MKKKRKGRIDKDSAFISYRREGSSDTARLIHSELLSRGYNVFLDVEELGKSYFDQRILSEIENAPDFILILSPGALDACLNDGAAGYSGKRPCHINKQDIIPILKEGFEFPSPGKAAQRTVGVAEIQCRCLFPSFLWGHHG